MIAAITESPIQLKLQEVKQGSTVFYIGSAVARDIGAISYSDFLRLEDSEIPVYTGLQRVISTERITEIEEYIATGKAIFPNAIILTISSEYIDKWDKNADGTSVMHIRRNDEAAGIIDGQHRLRALQTAGPDLQIAVSVFVDLTDEMRAEIFTKINSTQKPVNPSIAYQLFGYSSRRSPQRTAHEIAYAMNTKQGSPFFKRLKLLGTRDDFSEGSLSQATFARELLRLYTGKARKDEYAYMRDQKPEPNARYPLRDLFIAEKDAEILALYWKFFAHIAKAWPEQWKANAPGQVLTRTTGYVAWAGVLRQWLLSPHHEEVRFDNGVAERLATIQSKYEHPENRFTSENYKSSYGSAGELRDQLIKDLGIGPT